MTGAPYCVFCQVPDDVSEMKINNNCGMLDGCPCHPCRDHMEIEERIVVARQALENLFLERSKIRAKMNQNHDPITSRFPPEVISSIFQSSLPDGWNFSKVVLESRNRWFSESQRSMVSGPLFLGAICRPWRQIAWVDPHLWSTIRIFLEHHHGANDLDIALQWLNRAKQLPLSIFVRSPDRPPREFENPMASLINQRSPQWENLVVIGQRNLGPLSILEGTSQGAPALRALRIGQTQWASQGPPFFSLKGPMPQPSHVSLDISDFDNIRIDWSALTHFSSNIIYLIHCMELFRRAPRLVHCKMSLIRKGRDDGFSAMEPIVYKGLQSLELGSNENQRDTSIFLFFKMFTFPGLSDLQIEDSGNWDAHIRSDPELWSPLAALIARSYPPLILFKWKTNCGTFIVQHLISILQNTPSLVDLEVSAPVKQECQKDGPGDALFRLFADTSETQTFLPNLQSIVILDASNVAKWLWPRVIGIFGPISEIHNPRRRPLRTLRVRGDDYGTGPFLYKYGEEVRKLLELEQEGISIDIRTTNSVDALQKHRRLRTRYSKTGQSVVVEDKKQGGYGRVTGCNLRIA